MRSWHSLALILAILTHEPDLGWGSGSPESTTRRRCSVICCSAGPSRNSPDQGSSAQGLHRGLSSSALERDREKPTPPGAGERQDEDDTPEDQSRDPAPRCHRNRRSPAPAYTFRTNRAHQDPASSPDLPSQRSAASEPFQNSAQIQALGRHRSSACQQVARRQQQWYQEDKIMPPSLPH